MSSEDLRPVMIVWLTWDELAECPEHPHAEEFRRYLEWKQELAKVSVTTTSATGPQALAVDAAHCSPDPPR